MGDLRHLDVSGHEQLHVSRLHPDVIASDADFSQSAEFIAARRGKSYWSPVRRQETRETLCDQF